MGGYPGGQNGPSTVSNPSAARNGAGIPAQGGSSASTLARPTASELRQLRERREAQGQGQGAVPYSAGAGAGRIPSASNGAGVGSSPDDGALAPLPPVEIGYRYAMPVPGRSGWVYNPFTHTSVDARGVESGRLIYDETDPANRNPDGTLKPIDQMPHKFRVP